MGLFDFFKKADTRQERFEDEVLGTMDWSPDDEGWTGNHRGVNYVIAYDGQSLLNSDLLAYARMLFADVESFLAEIEQAKEVAAAKEPAFGKEIAELRLECLHFYKKSAVRRILADLEGGRRNRSWRVEFEEKRCEGLGFDT